MNTKPVSRNANLDLLRATAILLVVIYHLIAMSPVPSQKLMTWTADFQHGVDLFFVLSGWLIGTLYWKEKQRFGNVNLWRFWLRRWFRTIPPYLAALLFAWLAVFVIRREPFDWTYFLFLQNYSAKIPFFSVSWSLCIEEHFYLFLPLLLTPIVFSSRAIGILFALLIISAPIGRFFASQNGLDPYFGFQHTATHFRLEGLLLGFGAAYLPVFAPGIWKAIKNRSRNSLSFGLISLVVFIAMAPLWQYRLGLTILSCGLVAVLLFFVSTRSGAIASSFVTQWIAVSSYSVYLTHALMLQLGVMVAKYLPSIWFIYFPLSLTLIIVGGGIFYFAIEKTSITLRDRIVPRRISTTSRGDLIPD